MSDEKRWTIPVLTGFTGIGKTEFTKQLAKDHNIAVISADAFQVYKKMDIGTAKPSIEIQNQIKHYLIDILEPDQVYSAGDFVVLAEESIDDAISKGYVPIVVGGTAMYLDRLRNGIFQPPELDPEVLTQLKIKLENHGVETLYRDLQKIDPDYSQKITHRDTAKITRALHVSLSLNTTFTEAHSLYLKKSRYDYFVLALVNKKNTIDMNIYNRLLEMFNKGWEREVKQLLESGCTLKSHSFKAIGYKEIATQLLDPSCSQKELIEKIYYRTIRFAKRQGTWMRRNGFADVHLDLSSESNIHFPDFIFCQFEEY